MKFEKRIDSLFSTSFISLIASIGVVYYHLQGSNFYIGEHLEFTELYTFYKMHSVLETIRQCISGVSAQVGLFFIISGYGLAKKYKTTKIKKFYLNRFTKIYLFSLLLAFFCTILAYIPEKEFVFGYWSSFFLIYGFSEFYKELSITQYWFLSLIFFYYLTFPLLRKINFTTTNLFFAFLFSCGFGYLINYSFYPFELSFYHSTMGRFIEFFFGAYLANNKQVERYLLTYSIYRIFMGFIISLVGYSFLFVKLLFPFSYITMSIGLFLFLTQIAFKVSKLKIKPLIEYLKGGSFTLYLLHMVTIRYIFLIYTHYFRHFLVPYPFLQFILEFLIILCLCFILLIVGRKIEHYYNQLCNNDKFKFLMSP